MNAPHRTRVVLKLARRKALAVLAQAKAIHNALDADRATFASPVPPLPVLLAQIQELDVAQQATSTRAKGTAALRDTRLELLVTSLESERMYVQTLCDASPERAAAIAEGAAMAVAASTAYARPVLRARPGSQPGAVLLVANPSLLVGKRSSKRVLFNWQLSADGGRTWSSAPATPLAGTEIPGLAPLTTYAFRVCVTVSRTTREWSQAVTLLVT
jgi:hypothetical protein